MGSAGTCHDWRVAQLYGSYRAAVILLTQCWHRPAASVRVRARRIQVHVPGTTPLCSPCPSPGSCPLHIQVNKSTLGRQLHTAVLPYVAILIVDTAGLLSVP